MNKYYLHIDRNKANHAGSKAVDDCETIMKKRGYKNINLYAISKNKMYKMFVWMCGTIKLFFIPKGSLLVMQHPLYIHKDYLKLLKKIKYRGIKLVFIIHDLESARRILPDSEFYEKRDEVMFTIADYIIVHNEYMEKFLRNKGIDATKLVKLDIFDYLVTENFYEREQVSNADPLGIVVAGNLESKTCGYVYNNVGLPLNLYGVNFDYNLARNDTNYIGSFDADNLPNMMVGKYGLVWYGNDSNECGGVLKEYLQYINPHKVSAYIAAGIPIIIASNIGLASFVEREGIGIVIQSLDEIKDRISRIGDQEYRSMKLNVQKIADNIKAGHYLSTALEMIEQRIN